MGPVIYLFHDGDPYHKETSPLICRENQWGSFYMVGTSAMKELNINKLEFTLVF